MIFIFLLALILFGPKRLPEIAREVGKFMAEFKRASNDFKYQLQAEIDKASAPTPTQNQQSSTAAPVLHAGNPNAEQPGTPVVLPPAASTPAAAADAESEHERLMRTARMAFEAQNFTLRPPEPPPIPQTSAQPAPESPAADAVPATDAAPAGNSAVQQS